MDSFYFFVLFSVVASLFLSVLDSLFVALCDLGSGCAAKRVYSNAMDSASEAFFVLLWGLGYAKSEFQKT